MVASVEPSHGVLQVPLRLRRRGIAGGWRWNERLFVNKCSVLRALERAATVPHATCQKASWRRKRL